MGGWPCIRVFDASSIFSFSMCFLEAFTACITLFDVSREGDTDDTTADAVFTCKSLQDGKSESLFAIMKCNTLAMSSEACENFSKKWQNVWSGRESNRPHSL